MGTKTDTSAELVITNNTGLEISGFYTRPSGEEDWSEDYMDGQFVLEDQEQALFYYDSSAKDEDGETITKYDLMVTYSDEDEDVCFFRNLTLSDMEEVKLKMEDGVPFVTYTSLSTKRQISTLEDAKARMGRTDDDQDDEEKDGDDSDTTPTPQTTDTPDATSTPDPTETSDPDDGVSDYDYSLKDQAEGTVGSSVEQLMDVCGSPESSEYSEDPESGATIGYYYYDGFTVSTIEKDGDEIVTGVW
jgi:hypothetical protein